VVGLAAALALLLGFAGTSLAEVEGPGPLWPDPGVVRMKFAYQPDQAGVTGDGLGIYVNHDNTQTPPRTMRVYGHTDKSAAFPYQTFDGPFNLKSPEAPEKDFVVHNPAFFDHLDASFPLNFHINADENAYEKTHLRTWYTPCYTEPLGITSPMVPDEKLACYPAVVNEYTYILLDDDTLNPTHGSAGTTRMIFPMAYETNAVGNNMQVGLEAYDVNLDGFDEIMQVEEIVDVAQNTTMGEIWVKPESRLQGGNLTLTPVANNVMQFFDYEIRLEDFNDAEGWAVFSIYYVGRGCQANYFIDSVTLQVPGCTAPGCYIGDTALVPARFGQPDVIVDDYDNIVPQVQFVDLPFWFQLKSVNAPEPGGSPASVTVVPHRALKAGETFYVDGAEYDVAAIYILDDPDGTGDDEFKYITIRNPLNKDEVGAGQPGCPPNAIDIPILSVSKSTFPALWEPLPVLPPFNMDHERVDDVNIPDCLQGDPNGVVHPDEQNVDNYGDGDDGAVCGAMDMLDNRWDTIAERVVENEPPLEFSWVEERKEERFDTLLAEEKFTEPDEVWQWINIETRPWHFTSLNLPKVGEAPDFEAEGFFGDYILVSSLITEDSTETWPGMGSVRVKFAYDAGPFWNHDADIYVNNRFYNRNHPGIGIDVNSLRIYGRCDRNAAFPYTEFDGPFNLKSPEAPEKDFVVFNPAFIDHYDYGLPGEHIKADGDANEKVHLRMWYTPKYEEPAGETYPVVNTPVSNWDLNGKGTIPLEYTYIMIQDPFLDPTHGTAGNTQLVFPMAGAGFNPEWGNAAGWAGDDPQAGLDRYDINLDGSHEVMKIEAIVDVAENTTLGEIWVAPQPTVYAGMNLVDAALEADGPDGLDFLDYRVELRSFSTAGDSATFDVFYLGNRQPELIDTVTLSIYGDDAALFNRKQHVATGTEASIEGQVEAVTKPFWITLETVSTNNGVKVVPHRVLKAGESFFVDGFEYDVAAIYILDDPEGQGDEFKYITIRNPLDKCNEDLDDVHVPDISVDKVCVEALTPQLGNTLPLLPPFNDPMGGFLDLVDDTDLGPDDVTDDPDSQWEDNDGSRTTLNCDWIGWRIVNHDKALDVGWITETKEIRFDTNLLEEKFTEPEEEWMWINIETLPWHFTEFYLEDTANVNCDLVTGADSVGDYILVSSFMTEDSERSVDPCCQYNFNNNGGVDTQDVLMIADAWLTADPTYDLDNDGLVELDDIMKVVACWDPNLPCP
jgi:hypothetical protein